MHPVAAHHLPFFISNRFAKINKRLPYMIVSVVPMCSLGTRHQELFSVDQELFLVDLAFFGASLAFAFVEDFA
jgi:hypothetical protein